MNKLTEQNQSGPHIVVVHEIKNDGFEAKLRELTNDLIERIKELNCLYGISNLVEKRNI